MNEKKIKVYAQVRELEFDVYVSVPQDAWDKEIDHLEEEMKNSIVDLEEDEGIDKNDLDTVQERIAHHLMWECPFRLILEHLGALEGLRDALIKDLIEGDSEHQYEEALQMLKDIKDCEQAMIAPFEEEDEGKEYVTILSQYPPEMLDELARRFDGNSQR